VVKKFIVPDKTINRVLTWVVENDARDGGLEGGDAESLAKLGTSMLEMNCDAIDQLYGYGEAAEYRPPDYEFQWERTSEIQVLKSLQCWLEQCCGVKVAESYLYRRMKAIESRLACKLVSGLESYAAAE
jgi:hypothetical protein